MHVLFFKSHTFYFKPVPLYLPKERGETQHSIWRDFSLGNPHISSAYTADVAQSCQATFTSTVSRLTATPCHKSFQRNYPAPWGFSSSLLAVQRFSSLLIIPTLTYKLTKIDKCPEAPAAGKQTSLNNPGRKAKGVRKHPWATSHC